MTSITWAGPRCVQELATILAPQNLTQGRYDLNLKVNLRAHFTNCKSMILTNSDRSDVPVLGEGEEIQCEVSVSQYTLIINILMSMLR